MCITQCTPHHIDAPALLPPSPLSPRSALPPSRPPILSHGVELTISPGCTPLVATRAGASLLSLPYPPAIWITSDACTPAAVSCTLTSPEPKDAATGTGTRTMRVAVAKSVWEGKMSGGVAGVKSFSLTVGVHGRCQVA